MSKSELYLRHRMVWLLHEDEIGSVKRSAVDAALRPSGYAEGMLSGWDLDSTDPLKRDLA